MRRLDWFLAAIVASFLAGALAMAATGGLPSKIEVRADPNAAATDVSIQRIVSHLPTPQLLPGEAR